jgi:hypothetical protein
LELLRRDASELVARSDVELGEHFVQVVLHGPRADEQLSTDLGVREAIASQSRYLRFLWSQGDDVCRRVQMTSAST